MREINELCANKFSMLDNIWSHLTLCKQISFKMVPTNYSLKIIYVNRIRHWITTKGWYAIKANNLP